MRITIKDVAKQAQVSQATVSLVLNQAPGISAPTREHVLSVMKDLNYRPDALARSFSSRRARAVGLVMPPSRESFDDPYYTQLLVGVLEVVRNRGYHLLLEVADSRFGEQKLWSDLYTTHRVDGFLIITPHLDDDYLVRLAEAKVPVLLVNGARPDLPQLGFIGYDDVRCGMDATYYLIGLGHRKIAHVTGPLDQASSVDRLRGYREALDRARIQVDEALILEGDFKRPTGEAALDKIMKMAPADRPTAVFCANDTMAIGLMAAARQAGLSIPGDLSVVGVDDTGGAALSVPPLTTMRQDILTLAQTGTERFIALLEARTGSSVSIAERMTMSLVQRASCGLAPGASQSG